MERLSMHGLRRVKSVPARITEMDHPEDEMQDFSGSDAKHMVNLSSTFSLFEMDIEVSPQQAAKPMPDRSFSEVHYSKYAPPSAATNGTLAELQHIVKLCMPTNALEHQIAGHLKQLQNHNIESVAISLLHHGFVSQIKDGTIISEATPRSYVRTLRHRFAVVYAVRDSSLSTANLLQEPVICEPRFREQFVIMYPSAQYQKILETIPAFYVGNLARLSSVVQYISAAIAREFHQRNKPLPPWRTSSALNSKWCPEHITKLTRTLQWLINNAREVPAATRQSTLERTLEQLGFKLPTLQQEGVRGHAHVQEGIEETQEVQRVTQEKGVGPSVSAFSVAQGGQREDTEHEQRDMREMQPAESRGIARQPQHALQEGVHAPVVSGFSAFSGAAAGICPNAPTQPPCGTIRDTAFKIAGSTAASTSSKTGSNDCSTAAKTASGTVASTSSKTGSNDCSTATGTAANTGSNDCSTAANAASDTAAGTAFAPGSAIPNAHYGSLVAIVRRSSSDMRRQLQAVRPRSLLAAALKKKDSGGSSSGGEGVEVRKSRGSQPWESYTIVRRNPVVGV